jgi:hypothetical protein
LNDYDANIRQVYYYADIQYIVALIAVAVVLFTIMPVAIVYTA